MCCYGLLLAGNRRRATKYRRACWHCQPQLMVLFCRILLKGFLDSSELPLLLQTLQPWAWVSKECEELHVARNLYKSTPTDSRNSRDHRPNVGSTRFDGSLLHTCSSMGHGCFSE